MELSTQQKKYLYCYLAGRLKFYFPLQAAVFECGLCEGNYATAWQRDLHIRRAHMALRPHACPHCGDVFKEKHHRDRHVLRKHTKQRNFVCACGQRFPTRDNLSMHVKRRHGNMNSMA